MSVYPTLPNARNCSATSSTRARDQGFCRHAAIASAQRVLQHRLRLGRRFADVDVAPQDDGVRLPAVGGAALAIEIGLHRAVADGSAISAPPAAGFAAGRKAREN